MRAVRLAPWLALLVLAAALSLQKIRSFDYWFHLRTGQLIAETGRVPRVDTYSYSVPGAPYVDVHWLHQLVLHATHALGGHDAVVLWKLALVVALVALLGAGLRRSDRPALAAGAIALALVLCADRFMPRPELPTFVLLAATLLLFDRFEGRGGAGLYLFVPLQLVWVNLHGLFAVGFAVWGAHFAGELLRPLVRERVRTPRLRRLAAVGGGALAACFLNPHGGDALLYPFQQLLMIGTDAQRAAAPLGSVELLSLRDALRHLSPLLLAVFALLAALSGASLWLQGRRVRPADVLLWAAFLVLAFAAVRNLALFGVVAAPIFVRNASAWLDCRGVPPRAPRLLSLAVALLLVVGAWDVARGRFFQRLGSPREPGLGLLQAFYPVRAVEWIARERPPGPLGHHMADGGYLIWRLHPHYPVLSDGRLEVYASRPEVLKLDDELSFRELDARYRFGTVLLHYAQIDLHPLVGALHRDPQWRLAFVDEVAAVFIRRGPGEREPDLDVDAPDLFPAPPAERGYDHLMSLVGRARFYGAVRRPDRAKRLLKEARELYPTWLGGS
ncbi:MAG: hypothetical protein QNK03_20370 [Myxococcota bacterium]|nr:hypothetical protein [Myxococcota bacterium]